jgi:hypothetical protein
MKRVITSLLLTTCFYSVAFSQNAANQVQKAATNGSPVPTLITVGDSVRASAVLIPRVDARRIFGSEIANNYAVIEINVGNKSPDASLIVHGIFIDYSKWALRGGTGDSGPSESIDERYQSSTVPSHVASEEYRVVRGQLLDARNWSKRAWTMRLLTFAASLASAYSFSLKENGILKGLEAFGGVGVPGFREVWPDSTIEQLNNISDFGYRTNRAIPKQGAEVIVAFFPIERFLTPGFKKLYLKSPALFFAPLQMLVDKKIQKDVAAALDVGIDDFQALTKKLPCYMSVQHSLHVNRKAPDFDFCLQDLHLKDKSTKERLMFEASGEATEYRLINFLNAVSLNNVSVVIDGVMSVETTAIAASIDTITFDDVTDCGNDNTPCFWADLDADEGLRTGTITGKYLKGASIEIENAAKLEITDLKTISEGSDDNTLHFSFKVTKPIAPDQTLRFRVTKPNPANADKPLVSNTREFLIHHANPTPPEIKDVKQDEPAKGKLTIKGNGFLDSPTFPLTVKFQAPDGTETEAKIVEKHRTQFVVEMPSSPAGCWRGTVSLGTSIRATLNGEDCFCFFIAPAPKLDSATLDGRLIMLEGEDLVPTQVCKGPALGFEISKGDKTVKFQVVGPQPPDPTRMILRLRDGEPDIDEDWVVKVLLDGAEIKENGTAAIKKKAKPPQ